MLKRYILFIVLSFAAFWLYAILFPPQPPVKGPPEEAPEKETVSPGTPEEEKVDSEETADSEEPAEVQETRESPKLEKPKVTAEQREKEEKTWLENAYCRMRLTKFGAAIGEIVLHTTETNKAVVIQGKKPVRIPQRAVDEEQNPLAITSVEGEGLDLSTHSFELKEKSDRNAVYELGLDGGLKVTKSFELAKDDYFLTLEVAFENTSESAIRVEKSQVKVGTVFALDARAKYRNIGFVALGAEKVRKLSARPKKAQSES